MAWQINPGLPGKVFCPEVRQDKKHACPDCFACQQCSEERCALCRDDRMAADSGRAPRVRNGRSIAERQIGC